MSGTVTSSTGTAATTSSGSGVAAQTGSAALNSLSGNFSDFLTLLMTQLKNRDPTSPLKIRTSLPANWCSSPRWSTSTPTAT